MSVYVILWYDGSGTYIIKGKFMPQDNKKKSILKTIGKVVLWIVIIYFSFLVLVGIIHFISVSND